MSKRVFFRVHGTVQGVNFRNFTKAEADRLNLTGFVENAPQEKVIGEAQGDASAIAQLLKAVDQGPRHAHVVKLETKDLDLVEGEKSFQIKR